MWMKIFSVSLLCLLVNIPLGSLRERSRKFSWQWLLWVHASIPLIIALRIGLSLHWSAIPINIAAAVLGQAIGASPEKKRRAAQGSGLPGPPLASAGAGRATAGPQPRAPSPEPERPRSF